MLENQIEKYVIFVLELYSIVKKKMEFSEHFERLDIQTIRKSENYKQLLKIWSGIFYFNVYL